MNGKGFRIILQNELSTGYICNVYEIMSNNLYKNIFMWSSKNGNIINNCLEKEKLFTMFVGGLLLAQYQMAFQNKDKQICDKYINDAWKELYILLRSSLT